MQYPKYELTIDKSNNASYTFSSRGSSDEFILVIQFQKTNEDNVYNLAFGVKSDKGIIDDTVILNNRDRNVILATVAYAVFNFTERHRNAYIFFTGSTPARTRLYRMAISIHQEELETDFLIWGVANRGQLGLELFKSTGLI